MELFEEIVLTVLMMYISVKRAIAITKQIRQNAAVIASRFEIEEKSRSVENVRLPSTSDHDLSKHSDTVVPHVQNVHHDAQKASKLDISWPKDIIEDQPHLRILSNRTPSVCEIEENVCESSDDKSPSSDSLNRSSSGELGSSERSLDSENIPNISGPAAVYGCGVDNSEKPVSVNVDTVLKNSGSETEFSTREQMNNADLEVCLIGDTSESSTGDNKRVNLMKRDNDEKNHEPETQLTDCGSKPNILNKDTIASNELFDTKTIIDNDQSEFESALDDSDYSCCSSDTITNNSSLKSNSVDAAKCLVNAEILNKSKTDVGSVRSMKSAEENTVFLCSAKCIEETSVHNHLKLCNNGVVVGNIDMGQKVLGSADEDDSEIFYSAVCEEEKPFWLIFSGEYTKAMNKDWHSGHFCCWQCDESLTGQRYVLRDDHPYCIKCYESVFANPCEECNKIIGIDSKDLSYKDKHWHEACFLCNKCHVSLVDKQFGSKADKIYCGNCYDTQFASRCDGCGQIFRAGTKKMEYKTRQWHDQCFCCCVCKSPIGTKSFIPREQEIYCATCYEEKFATRCVKCNKIITSGGVTYKNEPWHRECFTCTQCNTSLAGQRFTSRDEKPYCADCFGELFAKRCTACCKPITGIGGTRFISFEDRHWHNDCFICASCKTSLVGRGFITDGDDIICPDCAKAKLM